MVKISLCEFCKYQEDCTECDGDCYNCYDVDIDDIKIRGQSVYEWFNKDKDDFLYDNDNINDHIIQKLNKNNVKFYNFYGGFIITDENVRITSTTSGITYQPPILITSADYDEGNYDEETEKIECTKKCAMIEDDYNGQESLLAGEVYDLIINKAGNSFLHEPEKMVDFGVLSKEEFLESYSYLTEEDYEITKEEYEDLL